MTTTFWHWPDHCIGKRESRRLREEHNATVNRLMKALDDVAFRIESEIKRAKDRELELRWEPMRQAAAYARKQASVGPAEVIETVLQDPKVGDAWAEG